jgi:hypothetical protein
MAEFRGWKNAFCQQLGIKNWKLRVEYIENWQ